MARECMLTTVDNPFNPFTDFDKWYLFDIEKNYNSCAYLGRIARISDAMTEDERNVETERAIDEIIKNDFLSMYRKVTN